MLESQRDAEDHGRLLETLSWKRISSGSTVVPALQLNLRATLPVTPPSKADSLSLFLNSVIPATLMGIFEFIDSILPP